MLTFKTLTDEQLLRGASLIVDPHAGPTVPIDKAEIHSNYELIGEYHVEKALEIRCSLCSTKHQNGWIIQGTRGQSLIGSRCGKLHFGLNFTEGTNALRASTDRQNVLRKLERYANQKVAYDLHFTNILNCEELRLLEECSDRIKRASGDFFIRARSSIIMGTGLMEDVRIRDIEAELNDNSDKPRKRYKYESRSIGQISGPLVITANDLRETAVSARVLFREVEKWFELRSQKSTTEISAFCRKVADTIDALNEVIEKVGQSHRFFEKRNISRLTRWATKNGDTSVENGVNGFTLTDKNGRSTFIPSLPQLSLTPIKADLL